jgi:hypothetical protein
LKEIIDGGPGGGRICRHGDTVLAKRLRQSVHCCFSFFFLFLGKKMGGKDSPGETWWGRRKEIRKIRGKCATVVFKF